VAGSKLPEVIYCTVYIHDKRYDVEIQRQPNSKTSRYRSFFNVIR